MGIKRRKEEKKGEKEEETIHKLIQSKNFLKD